MPLDQHCISRGCLALAVWGFGSALEGTIRFACTRHRPLIWPDDIAGGAGVAAGVTEGRGANAPLKPRPSEPQQPRLL